MGCNLTLTSLPPPKLLKSKLGKGSEKSLFISEMRVERAISKSNSVFALLLIESNTREEVTPIYPLAQSLLRELENVFPNDLPLGLPPLRRIENQIDLLSSAPLLNKSAYRCNPNESKEL